MNKIKKMFVVSIALFFVGISISPIIASYPEKTEKSTIPVQISMTQKEGIISTISEDLHIDDIEILKDIINRVQSKTKTVNLIDLIQILSTLFGKSGNIDLLSLLDGSKYIVFGVGQENHLLPTALLKVKFHKYFYLWSYTSEWSTSILFKGLLSMSQAKNLQGRQIGFMVGFNGLYIYIPDWVPGLKSTSLFIGTSSFAWGMAF